MLSRSRLELRAQSEKTFLGQDRLDFVREAQAVAGCGDAPDCHCMTTAPLERPWLVLAGLALGVTVTNGFARFAYGLLLPAMRSEMGWTYAQAGWLNTANALGYIAGAVLTMLLIRRAPPTRLFAIGMVTTTLALLATGLNAALWWQTVWRIAAGVLGAMSFSTAQLTCSPGPLCDNAAQFTYSNLQTAFGVNDEAVRPFCVNNASLWQVKFGVRYEF